ncbi:DHH family phosphoesterase [Desulfoluna spongiiphila]|uniref:DHH family phosphoesterase n=1 Tax=Desulfoluna spongiiphila TaxID=419481 RepID=UPI001254BE30|nr:bifunctional oligoribonuclease/PAP phosphatase NrnA [Desulfoluna spongiiphila]VVS92802.1 dhh phosphoesterase superfamily [Desulfoluna spongiiphila]
MKILESLKESRSLLLLTHVRPDGDAIGSALALGRALTLMGKHVRLYNESPIPAIFRFLPGIEQIVSDPGNLSAYDTAVVLDCSDLSRVGSLADEVGRIPTLLNIDHHMTNTGFGCHRLVDSSASSTGELVYRLLTDLDADIDEGMAYAIYTAIFTDTGSFLFQNTTPEAYFICGRMVEMGVDSYKVAQTLFATYSLGRLKLLNMVLDTIEISGNGKLSVMYLTQEMLRETETSVDDINGLVNYAKHIEDVQVAVLIQESRPLPGDSPKPHYHVSLRSNGPVDVGTIAAAYGGGGHPGAAAFTSFTSLKDIKKEVLRISDAL